MGVITTAEPLPTADDGYSKKPPPPPSPMVLVSTGNDSSSPAVLDDSPSVVVSTSTGSGPTSSKFAKGASIDDKQAEEEEEEELYVQVLRQRAKEDPLDARTRDGGSNGAPAPMEGKVPASQPQTTDSSPPPASASARTPPRPTRTTTTVALVPPAHLRHTSSTGSAASSASGTPEKLRAAGYGTGRGPSSYPQGIAVQTRHDVTAGGVVGSVRSAPGPSPASLAPLTSPGAFRVSSCTIGQMRDVEQDQGIESDGDAAGGSHSHRPPSLAYEESSGCGTVATAGSSSVVVEAYVDEKSVGSSGEDSKLKKGKAYHRSDSDKSDLLVVEAKPFDGQPPECYKPPTPRRKVWCWLGPVLVVVVIGVAVAIAMGVTTSSTRAASSASSGATYYQDQLRQVLPNATQVALVDLTSPQYVALAWATSDSERGRNYSSDKQRQARTLQRFALATIFSASRGNTKWTNNYGWMNSSVDECSWYGVSCSPPDDSEASDQRVRALNLTLNGLDMQSLPHEIAMLKSLQVIDLSFNKVSGSLSQALVALSNLQVLNLKSTSLTGSVTPSLVEAWAKLTVLDLSWNKLNGTIPSQVGRLENLTALHLGAQDSDYEGKVRSGLSGVIPTQIGNLKMLESLSLEVGALSGPIPTEVGRLNKLKLLRLGDNCLNGPVPSELGLLDALEELEIDRNDLTGSIPDSIAQLPLLQTFAADGNLLTGQITDKFGVEQSSLISFSVSDNLLNGSVPVGLCDRVPDGLVVTVDCESVTCDCGCQCAQSNPDPSKHPVVGSNSSVLVDDQCWDNFTALFDELRTADASSSKTYVICPNRRYSIGYESGPGNCCVDGDLPLVARANTRIQCGSDGSSSNDCVLVGGTSHVIVNDVIFGEDADGSVFQGFTFESPTVSTVIGVGNGNVTFLDCIFKVCRQKLLRNCGHVQPRS
jgi:hypothetical protein